MPGDTSKLVPYPTELAPSALLLLEHLRGQNPDTACAVHCAWNVVGYGLGTFLPHQHVEGNDTQKKARAEAVAQRHDGKLECGPMDFSSMNRSEGMKALAECCGQGSEGRRGILDNPFVKKAAQFAFQLLLQWMSGQTPVMEPDDVVDLNPAK